MNNNHDAKGRFTTSQAHQAESRKQALHLLALRSHARAGTVSATAAGREKIERVADQLLAHRPDQASSDAALALKDALAQQDPPHAALTDAIQPEGTLARSTLFAVYHDRPHPALRATLARLAPTIGFREGGYGTGATALGLSAETSSLEAHLHKRKTAPLSRQLAPHVTAEQYLDMARAPLHHPEARAAAYVEGGKLVLAVAAPHAIPQDQLGPHAAPLGVSIIDALGGKVTSHYLVHDVSEVKTYGGSWHELRRK